MIFPNSSIPPPAGSMSREVSMFRIRSKIDRGPENQQNGSMNITFDLPPELVREVKLRAVHEGRKLKDVEAD
jgi:hypothetical protein